MRACSSWCTSCIIKVWRQRKKTLFGFVHVLPHRQTIFVLSVMLWRRVAIHYSFSQSVLFRQSLPLVPKMTPDGLHWRISTCAAVCCMSKWRAKEWGFPLSASWLLLLNAPRLSHHSLWSAVATVTAHIDFSVPWGWRTDALTWLSLLILWNCWKIVFEKIFEFVSRGAHC